MSKLFHTKMLGKLAILAVVIVVLAYLESPHDSTTYNSQNRIVNNKSQRYSTTYKSEYAWITLHPNTAHILTFPANTILELDKLDEEDLKKLGEKAKELKEELEEGEVEKLHRKHGVKK
jgi:hypothetical protein